MAGMMVLDAGGALPLCILLQHVQHRMNASSQQQFYPKERNALVF
jgi:hypothetical protein